MILETLSLTVRPQSSGEPDAGKPPVRFGGRGDLNTVVPTPIYHSVPTGQKPPVTCPRNRLHSIFRGRGRRRVRARTPKALLSKRAGVHGVIGVQGVAGVRTKS